MFLPTTDGSYINADVIEELRPTRSEIPGKRHTLALLRDGGHATLMHDIEEIASFTSPTVPAQIGFELLVAYGEEIGDLWVDRLRIIAWRISIFGGTEPVVVDHVADNAISETIKFPSGACVNPNVNSWPSEEAWRESLPDALKTWREAEARAKLRAQNRGGQP